MRIFLEYPAHQLPCDHHELGVGARDCRCRPLGRCQQGKLANQGAGAINGPLNLFTADHFRHQHGAFHDQKAAIGVIAFLENDGSGLMTLPAGRKGNQLEKVLTKIREDG